VRNGAIVSHAPTFRSLGSGPTIVMLHGIGGGNMAFAPQVESFSLQGWRAVAWDMPGYGHCPPIEPYTFKGLAESAARLIEVLDASGNNKPVVLLGHSMGGMVAQEVIARRPGLVRALVLSATSASFGKPDGEWQRRFIEQRTAPLAAGQSMLEMAQALVPGMTGTTADPHGLRLATQVMGNVPAATYRAALHALLSFDRREALARIRVPTLLIAGEQDPNAPPAVMQAMAKQIAGAEYVELAGVGHLANLEAPELFDGTVLSFLARRVLATHLH
jgi:pimeloyl-ACP methyl ester carboxylesterase